MMTTTPKHVYISGPMRDHDGFNFPSFFAAEATVREMFPKADICNPAREDVARFNLHDTLRLDPTGLTAGRYLQEETVFGPAELRQALGNDLKFICERCDMIVMLPGWEHSSGAKAEVATAQALGIPVVLFKPAEEASEHDPAVDVWREAVGGDLRASALPRVQSPTAPASRATGRRSAAPGPGSGPVEDSLESKSYDPRTELRVTSKTGGEKGTKLAAFDQISPEVERLVAEHFGKGARKYAAHNFRNGYAWSLSYSALRRHLADFWQGKEYDTCPEDGAGCAFEDGASYEPGTCYNHTGSLHIVAVIWHAMVLTEFFLHQKEYDDRYVYATD